MGRTDVLARSSAIGLSPNKSGARACTSSATGPTAAFFDDRTCRDDDRGLINETFLALHEIALQRGDGLRPEL